MDQLDIVPGQRWDRAIESALSNCPCLLVILSPASVNSTNVMDEVSFALEEQRTVIPILYKECLIPFRLRRVQHLDFRQDYARGLRELLSTLAIEPRTPPSTAAVLGVTEPAGRISETSTSATPEPPAIVRPPEIEAARRDAPHEDSVEGTSARDLQNKNSPLVLPPSQTASIPGSSPPPEQPTSSRSVTPGFVRQKVELHPETSSPGKFVLLILGAAAVVIVVLLVFSGQQQSPPSQQPQQPVSAHDRAMQHYMLAGKAATTDEKISEYREALREEPENADIHYQLADVLANGDRDGAIAEYREVIRLRPTDIRGYLQLGDLLRSQKSDLKAAITVLQEAARLFPNDPDPHEKLGFALEQKGDLPGALEQYRLCESKPHPYYDFPECQAGDKRLSANPGALKGQGRNAQ